MTGASERLFRQTAKSSQTTPLTNARKFGILRWLMHKHRRGAPERAAVIMGF